MLKKIKIIPIALLSLACISATVISVNNYINSSQEENPVKNPVLLLDANDPQAHFSSGDQKISKVVRYGTRWSTYKNNMPIPTKPGFDILGWEYSSDGVNFLDVFDDLVFNADTYLRVKGWGAATYEHFATDSWATIVSIAQQGLGALKETYYEDISGFGNTFVIQDYTNEQEVAAKTRTVYLKGMGEYTVHVIGEDEDRIAGSDNKVAALTFEFNNVAVPSIGFSMGNDNNSWKDSYLRYFLQTSFIQRLPEPINDDEVLQTVVKKTYDQMSDTPDTYVETNDTIFVPSLSELGYSNMLEDPLYIADPIGDHNILCKDEGRPYSFYQYGKNADMLVKKYNDGIEEKPVSYWTRSPFTKNVFNYFVGQITGGQECKGVHFIDDKASVVGMRNLNIDRGIGTVANAGTHGVAPCFCIGEDTVHKLTVNVVGDDNNIIAKHTDYIANGLDAKVQLIDKRDYSAPVIHLNTVPPEQGEPYEFSEEIHVEIGDDVISTAETIDDTEYTNYSYDNKTGLLNINIDKNCHLIDEDVTVTIDKPTAYSFESDSWETFLANAESGYENLKTVYAESLDRNGGNFIGLKREIHLKDNDYESTVFARVIGEKHDDTIEGNKTALTFQFTQGYEINETISYYPMLTHDQFYISEHPLEYLGYLGEAGEEGASLRFTTESEQIKENFIQDTGFSSGIKSVTKKVVQYNMMTKRGELESFNAQFFLPSYEELTGSSELSFEGEGNQYEYYVNSSNYAHRFNSGPYARWNYGDTQYITSNYCWTRSVSNEMLIDPSECKAVAVDGLTGLATALGTFDNGCAIIPCFCIGLAEAQ